MNIPMYYEKSARFYAKVIPDSEACPWIYEWLDETWVLAEWLDEEFLNSGTKHLAPSQLPFSIRELPEAFLIAPFSQYRNLRIKQVVKTIYVGGLPMGVSHSLYRRLREEGIEPIE